LPDSPVQALREPLSPSFDCKVSRNTHNVNSVETSFCIPNTRIPIFPAPYTGVTAKTEYQVLYSTGIPQSPPGAGKNRKGRAMPTFFYAFHDDKIEILFLQ
jgi:hypothetical protein